MKVSVIVPIYNKAKHLSKTIKSVLNQTYDNFELLLINDGSTDESLKIIRDYENKDERIIVYDKQNEGVSLTRNFGLEVATGEYISFLDADDEWDKSFLSKMITKVKSCNVVYCGHYYRDLNSLTPGKMVFKNGQILSDYILNKTTPNTNSWIIRRDYLNNHNLRFDSSFDYGEDMLFFSEVLLNTNKVDYVDEHLTYYDISVESSLTSDLLSKMDMDLEWMKALIGKVKVSNLNSKEKRRCIRAIEEYRMPASVVQKILNSIETTEKNELKVLYAQHQDVIKELSMVNGLRSINLWLKKKYLDFKLGG